MDSFSQARWGEPLIFELKDYDPTIGKEYIEEFSRYIPEKYIRKNLNIPSVPMERVVRHFMKLSQMNYSIDLGIYPLGSCTMKYNPKISEYILDLINLDALHPYLPSDALQGLLSILYDLKVYLCKITGMDHFSLQPAAGAHGEYVGVLIIKKFHEVNGRSFKDEIIIPDSAHGTNPASAKMAGFKVVEIPSNSDGLIDIDALKSALSKYTAGMMLTNPNTLGLFEENILEITSLVHGVGGLMYYDGANLNAIMGIVRPGDMGFDIVHVNLHKTFGTPHGGGGPGSGPVGVKSFLKEYLPLPYLDYKNGKYMWRWDLKYSIGKVHGYYGNVSILIRALINIIRKGGNGLRNDAIKSVINSNYLMNKLRKLKGVSLPFSPKLWRMHEFVLSFSRLKMETGVSVKDVAKRLLDYGIHPPTIYFPHIVDEAFMVEPTESASKEELDNFIKIMEKIIDEAYKSPNIVKSAPHNTSVKRIDEAYGSRPKTMAPTYRWLKKFK